MATTVSSAKVLGGKFIIEQMFEGSGSKNYKVADMKKPSTYYIVKEPVFPRAMSEEDQKNLTECVHKEVELLSGLKHPQISPFISFFQERGNYYFVMEFAPGRNLERVLEDTGNPLEEVQVIKWMMSICEALTYLHLHMPPIILENMRSSDIMVTPEGHVRLIDIGTWRRLSLPYWPRETFRTGPGKYILPPDLAYRSPESLQERRTWSSACSDIYSLGTIIYHLLTNDDPEPIATPQVGSILAKNPKLHTIQVDGKIVCPIEQVIIKSLQQNPELRFQNANDMQTALEDCLSK